MLRALNSDTKFSLEIFDLYLEFIKFTVENLFETYPTYLQCENFPMTKSNFSF